MQSVKRPQKGRPATARLRAKSASSKPQNAAKRKKPSSSPRTTRKIRGRRRTSTWQHALQLLTGSGEASVRHWRRLSLLVVVVTLAIGALQGGHMTNAVQMVTSTADHMVQAAGFGIKKISIAGHHRVKPAEISQALAVVEPMSILSFDTHAAQDRIQKLAWVRKAQVMRLLPSRLHIEIEERQPFAYWQVDQKHILIDTDGKPIIPVKLGEFGRLPVIVGVGAPKTAGELLTDLMSYPELSTRLRALVRVADRRWTVKLQDGPDILLPAKGIETALERFARMNKKEQLLERPLEAIDLRLPDRVTLRFAKDAWRDITSSLNTARQHIRPAERLG